MTTRGMWMAVACVAAILSFGSTARGQAAEWRVFVDGSPLPLPRPMEARAGDLYIPLMPVARALGFQVELAPEIQGLRLRRGAGAEIEYNGRTGEIRFGPVVAGQLRNHQQIPIVAPVEELLFPVDGLITMLAVDVQVDSGARALHINTPHDPLNVPTKRIGLSAMDYSLGATRTNSSGGHYAMLRSSALSGGIPFTSSFLLGGQGAGTRLQQGTVIADVGPHRVLTVGDQSTISGIDALVSSVRGVGFGAPLKTSEASVYAGRTAGTVRAQVGAPGVSNYDATIVGAALRKRGPEGDLSFAANHFNGPERQGFSGGASYARTTERNQIKAQIVAGAFSGLSLRTAPIDIAGSAVTGDPGAVPELAAERLSVQGGAIGLSLLDTFRPIEPLSITAHLERYGRNFLTARENSDFNAQSSQRLSMTLRPLPSLSLHGGVMRRRYLAGDPDLSRGFNYGASGVIPAVPWLQLGYFRSVHNETGSALGRIQLAQYSVTLMNLREYTASLTYSTLAFNGSTARVSNASLSRNFSFGQLMIRDQFQLKNFHRYGAEWQFFIPRGSLRVGLDRVVNLRAEDRSFAPLLGLNFALPGKQRLVTTYSGERGAHTVHVYIAGPVITRDDIRRGEDGRVSVVSPASLEGRVFHDVNGDNAFTSNTDIPMPGIRIWLDRNNSVITDAQGAYRFSNLKSGTHAVRADLAEVPADMVFADSGDRRVALLPFRDNVQNFAVVRTGSVSGKVTFLDYSRDPDKPTSRPLAEARVIADSEHDTYSDLSGNITLGSLRPGAYQLKVDPETAPEGYVASVEPQEIVVKAGENLSGIQIQLKLAPRKVVSQELPRQSIDVP